MRFRRGLANPRTNYGLCLDRCDAVNPRMFPSTDAYAAAYATCLRQCVLDENYNIPIVVADLPPGMNPSDLPPELQPPPGYEPQYKTNWWRVGTAIAIGLSLGVYLFTHSTKGARHGA
jgi:hypothetical protein